MGIHLIHSHCTALLTVAIFLFWQSKGKEVSALTKQAGTACFKNSCGTPVENRWSIGKGVLDVTILTHCYSTLGLESKAPARNKVPLCLSLSSDSVPPMSI